MSDLPIGRDPRMSKLLLALPTQSPTQIFQIEFSPREICLSVLFRYHFESFSKFSFKKSMKFSNPEILEILEIQPTYSTNWLAMI